MPRIFILALMLLSSLALAHQNVTLRFDLKAGDMPARCGQELMLGSTQAMTQLLDARLFVSDIVAITSEGEFPLELDQDGQWQYENLALLDFEDATGACTGTADTHTQVSGEVTAHEPITAIRFTIGVPESLNHIDAATAPAPLNVTDMWWVWRSGYKFLKIDLDNQVKMEMSGDKGHTHTDAGHGHGAGNAYFMHLGSTGCMSPDPTVAPEAPCSNANRMVVSLDNFDPNTQTVVLDIKALLEKVDVSQSLALEPPGCMSGVKDPDCVALFATGFGLSLNNGQQLVNSPAFVRAE